MGIYGPFAGWFTTATSIALGPEGNVFVADFYNDRIQKFTAKGDYLTAFGSAPDNPGHTAMLFTVKITEIHHGQNLSINCGQGTG